VPSTRAGAIRAPHGAGAAVVRHNRAGRAASAPAAGSGTYPSVGLDLLQLNPASDQGRLQQQNSELKPPPPQAASPDSHGAAREPTAVSACTPVVVDRLLGYVQMDPR